MFLGTTAAGESADAKSEDGGDYADRAESFGELFSQKLPFVPGLDGVPFGNRIRRLLGFLDRLFGGRDFRGWPIGGSI
mgnify:CR=1